MSSCPKQNNHIYSNYQVRISCTCCSTIWLCKFWSMKMIQTNQIRSLATTVKTILQQWKWNNTINNKINIKIWYQCPSSNIYILIWNYNSLSHRSLTIQIILNYTLQNITNDLPWTQIYVLVRILVHIIRIVITIFCPFTTFTWQRSDVNC